MPLVLFEPPSHFASLKAWEAYRAELDRFSDEEIDSSQKKAADDWIAHLRAKEGSSAKRTPNEDGREEE